MTVHTRLVPHRPDAPFRLGRHVEHDDGSRDYPFRLTKAGAVVGQTIYWPTCKAILNQKDLGGCVGFTGADFLNLDMAAAARKRLHGGRLCTNADGIRFYELATTDDDIDGQYPPNDTGSSGLGLAKALQGLGLISGYTHAFGFEHFRTAIAAQPVCVGTSWTNDMFRPDKDGLVHVGDLSDSNIAGGHEYMVRGIDYEKKRVRARNHWTRSWGNAGEFDIGFTDFEALLAADGDVVVPHLAA